MEVVMCLALTLKQPLIVYYDWVLTVRFYFMVAAFCYHF